MKHRILDTFTGPFTVFQHDDGTLCTTWNSRELPSMLATSRLDRRLLPDLVNRLRAYFDGDEGVDFGDIPTPAAHGEFFSACWKACRRIPRGRTISYAELAVKAGSTTAASRAAGQSMRRNPLPIIIPCHRVVAASGKLHGFGGSCDSTGPALGVKRALLRMEGWLADVVDEPPLFRTVRTARSRTLRTSNSSLHAPGLAAV